MLSIGCMIVLVVTIVYVPVWVVVVMILRFFVLVVISVNVVEEVSVSDTVFKSFLVRVVGIVTEID